LVVVFRERFKKKDFQSLLLVCGDGWVHDITTFKCRS
jgi:hypothetical protein